MEFFKENDLILLIKLTCAFLIEPQLKAEIITIQSLLQSLLHTYLFSSTPLPIHNQEQEKLVDGSTLNEKYFKLCNSVFDMEYFKEIHFLELIPNIFGDFRSFPLLRYFKCKLAFYAARTILSMNYPKDIMDVTHTNCKEITFSAFNLYPQPGALSELLRFTLSKVDFSKCEKTPFNYRKYYIIINLIDLATDKIHLSAAAFSDARKQLKKELEQININLPDSTVINVSRFRVFLRFFYSNIH